MPNVMAAQPNIGGALCEGSVIQFLVPRRKVWLTPGAGSQLRHVSTTEKNLSNSNISPTCSHNMVNFGPVAAEICWRVWGTPANFNGFRVLAALLHGTLVVGVRHTLRR